jgi:hypothetical protein
MADVEFAKEVIAPPSPPYQVDNLDPTVRQYFNDLYKFNYLMWVRTGKYNSIIPNLTGLKASVKEMNTLFGIDTSQVVQTQLNRKADCSIVNVDTNHVSNIDTSEDSMLSYTLPANSLSATNSFVEVEAYGTFTANADNKEVRLYFGTSIIFDSGSMAFNGSYWHVKAKIINSSITQQCIIDIITSDTLLPSSTVISSSTADLSIDNIIHLTAQADAANDISQDGLIIKLYN